MSCYPSAPQTEQGWGGWTLTPNTPNLKIIRSIYEAVCYVARRIADQVSLPDG